MKQKRYCPKCGNEYETIYDSYVDNYGKKQLSPREAYCGDDCLKLVRDELIKNGQAHLPFNNKNK